MDIHERNSHDHLLWKETGRRKVFDGPIFDLYTVTRNAPNGMRGEFILLDCSDWVIVVALVHDENGDDSFLMVRQFRQGSQSLTLEFPGGVIDEGESPETAARRELLEETGYRAEKVTYAGRIRPNPAFQGNWAYIYIAEDLVRIADQDLDEHELLDFEIVRAETVEREMGQGPFTHAIMMVALGFYERWKKYGTP